MTYGTISNRFYSTYSTLVSTSPPRCSHCGGREGEKEGRFLKIKEIEKDFFMGLLDYYIQKDAELVDALNDKLICGRDLCLLDQLKNKSL